MTFFTLFVASASPVLEVCLMAAVGLFLARRGKLTNDGKKMLAALVYLVFAPCLTFTKLSEVVTLDTLRSWWPLWLNVAAGIGMGAVMGVVAGRLLRLPRQYRTLVTAACAFGNVGNLPLVLMDTICKENHSPFESTMDAESCVAYGIGYVVFGMCMATLMVFSIALPVLRHAAAEINRQQQLEVVVCSELTSRGPLPDKHVLQSSGGPATPSGAVSRDKLDRANLPQTGAAALGSRGGYHSAVSSSTDSLTPFADGDEPGPPPDALPQYAPLKSLVSPLHETPEQAAQESSGWVRQRCDSTFQTGGRRPDAALLHCQHHTMGECGQHGQDTTAPQPPPLQSATSTAVQQPARGLTKAGLNSAVVVDADTESDSETDGLLGRSRESLQQGPRGVPRRDPQGSWVWSRGRHCIDTVHRCMCSARCQKAACRVAVLLEPVAAAVRQVPWKDMLSPPFVSALVAIGVGCIAPLKEALVGDKAALGLPYTTMSNMAGACIPLMMLALGSTFSDGPGAGTTMPRRAVAAVVAVRLVLLPLAGIAMLYLLDMLHVLPPEPLFRLALLLQQTAPTAIMLQTLLLMLPTGAQEFGLLLFWQYIASIFTTPCFIMLYFKILGLQSV